MGSADEWRINWPEGVALGAASRFTQVVMKVTRSTKTQSCETKSTGSAPRQKQSPQLQSAGNSEPCSPSPAGCEQWSQQLVEDIAPASIPLAKQPLSMH